jgi:hypothetical protein
MSTVIGLWASFTDWAVALIQNPKIQTAAIVFLVVLWTSIGITVLIDRRKPRVTKADQDYRYGLTFEGLMLHLLGTDFDKDDSELGFGIQLRNFSSGPIKYTVEDFDVRVGNRALPRVKKGALIGFMARGSGRTSNSGSFKRSDFSQVIGRRLEGTANLLISYGHPERPPVRRMSISIALILEIPESGPIGFGANIIEESDQALDIV